MGNKKPQVIILAGPNGAGKSTTAPLLLRDTFAVDEFVNADAIAYGLSAFAPEKAALEEGDRYTMTVTNEQRFEELKVRYG